MAERTIHSVGLGVHLLYLCLSDLAGESLSLQSQPAQQERATYISYHRITWRVRHGRVRCLNGARLVFNDDKQTLLFVQFLGMCTRQGYDARLQFAGELKAVIPLASAGLRDVEYKT